MKKVLLQLLQFMLLLVGLVIIYLMIRLPQTEGRAKDLDNFQIYSDPFILYGYVNSIPFFIALYNGIRLLRLIAQNKWFSIASANTLKRIRYCTLLSMILIAGAGVFILITHDKEDDPVGFIVICLAAFMIGIVTIWGTINFEKKLRFRLKKDMEKDTTL
jgi:hypothetical protein